MVLAPEHPLVGKLTTPGQKAEVEEYILQAARQSDIQREAGDKEKTGIFTGGYAINPVNDRRIPVWIADYVLMTYGTGAIMAVPAHDERDFAFALKFGLPILPVIADPHAPTKSFVRNGNAREANIDDLTNEAIPFTSTPTGLQVSIPHEKIGSYIVARQNVRPELIEVIGRSWSFILEDGILERFGRAENILLRCKQLSWMPGFPDGDGDARARMVCDALYFDGYGSMIHSGEFTGTPGETARREVTEWLERKGAGKGAVNYRLRDWLISRQRYWGAPIPIIYARARRAADPGRICQSCCPKMLPGGPPAKARLLHPT
jgi:leucyl-tRNA synthetase